MSTRRTRTSDRRLWTSPNGRFAIAECSGQGAVIYQGRPIGRIRGIPVQLLINKPYAAIDAAVRAQPRTDQGRLLEVCYRLFARHRASSSFEAQRILLERSRPIWPKGHPLLEAVAENTEPAAWTAEDTEAVFGKKYFASTLPLKPLLVVRHSKIEHGWEQQGMQRLPHYFARFGVISAESYLRDRQAKIAAEAKSMRGREPRPAETEMLSILADALGLLAPALATILQKAHLSYRISRSKLVVGTLRLRNGLYRPRIYLTEQLFSFEFSKAFALFIHEHAHFYGYDGDREFTDALTWMLEATVRLRHELTHFEQLWESCRKPAPNPPGRQICSSA